jgi:hypothetical protein
MRRIAAVWTPFAVLGFLLWLSSVGVGTSTAYRSLLVLVTLLRFGRVADARA